MMPLFEKFQTGNESPNQIVVVKSQEVGNDAFLSLPPVSQFSKLDKMG